MAFDEDPQTDQFIKKWILGNMIDMVYNHVKDNFLNGELNYFALNEIAKDIEEVNA